jgi:hypothetical protein
VSGTDIILITAATMAIYHNLSEFEHGVIVGTWEMGYSISEVVMCCGFTRINISQVHNEYCESSKTLYH